MYHSNKNTQGTSMSQKRRGLSRGLDALLAGTGLIQNKHNKNIVDTDLLTDAKPEYQPQSTPINNTVNSQNMLSSLKINQLVPGKFQPRQSMPPQELSELVESIKTQGVLQPLIVRQLTPQSYEIIAGERRWRAATLAELKEVPVIIKNVNNKDALTIALIENIQRENLNTLDEAIALDRLTKEFSLTHNEVAMAVGKSRTAITNLLRILQLPNEIKNMLEKQQLDLGHAKVLLGAPNNLQIQIANKVVADGLSVRSTEQLLIKYQQPMPTSFNQTASHKNKLTADPDIAKLQRQLSDNLGAKVTIITKSKGRGKLMIEYNSLEELEGILEHIKITEDY